MANDSQLVELLENMLLTPASDFYLSSILHNPNGEALDPRHVDDLDLGTIELMGLTIGLDVKNLEVHGLSNTQVKFDAQGNPLIVVAGSQVTFHAKLPNTQDGYVRPPDVPAQAQATGELYVTLMGKPMPPGTIAITIASIDDLTGVFTATTEQDGKLDTAVINFSKIAVTEQPGGVAMKVTVDLATAFRDSINYVLNQPDMQKTILEQVNAKLASPDVLSSLSSVATAEARKALSGI